MEDEERKREVGEGGEAKASPTHCVKSTRVTLDQLAKLQELHKRRLRLKSKVPKKPKCKDNAGATDKPHGKDTADEEDKDSGTRIAESGDCDSKDHQSFVVCSTSENNVAADHIPVKRKKLHWGLDTKERWERKANM